MPARHRQACKVLLHVGIFAPFVHGAHGVGADHIIQNGVHIHALTEQLLRTQALSGPQIPGGRFRPVGEVGTAHPVVAAADADGHGEIAVFGGDDAGVLRALGGDGGDLPGGLGGKLAVGVGPVLIRDPFLEGIKGAGHPFHLFGDEGVDLGGQRIVGQTDHLGGAVHHLNGQEIVKIGAPFGVLDLGQVPLEGCGSFRCGTGAGALPEGEPLLLIVEADVCRGDIARPGDGELSVVGGHPADQGPDDGVLRLRSAENGVVFAQQGIFSGGHGLLAGSHAVHLDELDLIAVAVHIRGVGVDGIADGSGGVVIDRDHIHQALHTGGPPILGGVHQGSIAHEVDHVVLGAGVVVALVGDDGQILAADLGPVGDGAGVDAPKLLLGQGIHGVVRVDHEDEALHGDGDGFQFNAPLRSDVPLLLGGRCGEDHLYGTVQQIVEGIPGGAVDDLGRSLLFGDVQKGGADPRLQGDQAGGAIHGGQTLPQGQHIGLYGGRGKGGRRRRFRGRGGRRRRRCGAAREQKQAQYDGQESFHGSSLLVVCQDYHIRPGTGPQGREGEFQIYSEICLSG